MRSSTLDTTQRIGKDTLVEEVTSGMVALPPTRTRRLGAVVGGRYRLMTLLGAGAAGAVFEARDEKTGSMVAVKVLHDQHATSKEQVARFLREARIASSIGHPGIVEVFDAGRDEEGRCYIVMEMLDGIDLATAIENGRLTVGDVVEVARQLLSVLSAAHKEGIVHRDVKPENVLLLTEAGQLRVKLLDFGIAKLNVEGGRNSLDTQDGVLLGTPYYMSPEQCRGQKLGPRSDLYSVGAMLFHCLAGEPPHDDDNLGRLLEKIVSTRTRPLASLRPDITPALCEAIDKVLSLDPKDRYASADAMAAALHCLAVPIANLDWDDF